MNEKGNIENNEFWMKQSKDTGMKVPEGYFDQLESDVLAKIKQEPQIQESSGMRRIWIGIAVAASIIGVVFWNLPATETERTDELLAMTTEEVMDWESLDEAAIADYLSMEEIEELDSDEFGDITAEEAYEYALDANYSEFILTENFE